MYGELKRHQQVSDLEMYLFYNDITNAFPSRDDGREQWSSDIQGEQHSQFSYRLPKISMIIGIMYVCSHGAILMQKIADILLRLVQASCHGNFSGNNSISKNAIAFQQLKFKKDFWIEKYICVSNWSLFYILYWLLCKLLKLLSTATF